MKLVHEGQYIAEVDIDLIEEDTGWSPYVSLEDAQKHDQVRRELRVILDQLVDLLVFTLLLRSQFSLKWATCRWRESDIIRYCDMLEGFCNTRLQLVLYRIFSV